MGRRVEVAVTVALLGAVTVAASQLVPHNRLWYLDQITFRDTHWRMWHGAGFYDAFRDAYLAIDVRMGEVRAYRQPLLFLFWRPFPDDWLLPLFFVVCVLGTGLACLLVARRPVLAVAAAVWVAAAGHHAGADGWLLSELWALPLVVAACGMWLRDRHGLAAGFATVAFLVREITAPLLLGFALAQWRRGRPVRPYVAGIAVAAAGYAAHAVVALQYVDPPGNEAATFGTGRLRAIADMVTYGDLLLPAVVGLAIWAVGLVQLWRSPLRPAVALALLPLSGLVIDRVYWGMTFMPMLAAVALGVADAPVSERAPSRTPPSPPRPVATTAP